MSSLVLAGAVPPISSGGDSERVFPLQLFIILISLTVSVCLCAFTVRFGTLCSHVA